MFAATERNCRKKKVKENLAEKGSINRLSNGCKEQHLKAASLVFHSSKKKKKVSMSSVLEAGLTSPNSETGRNKSLSKEKLWVAGLRSWMD